MFKNIMFTISICINILSLTSCNSGGNNVDSTFPQQATYSSEISIDSSSTVPIFTTPTRSYIYVHNHSNVIMNNISYSINGGDGFQLDPYQCASIPAGEECKLWFTTPAGTVGYSGSVFIQARYINSQQVASFSANKLSFAYADLQAYNGVNYLAGNSTAGDNYYTVYFFNSTNSDNVVTLSSSDSGINVLNNSTTVVFHPRQIIPIEVERSVTHTTDETLTVQTSTGNNFLVTIPAIVPNNSGYLVMSDISPINVNESTPSRTITIMNLGTSSASSISIPSVSGLTESGGCLSVTSLNPGGSCSLVLTPNSYQPGSTVLTVNYTNTAVTAVVQTVSWYNSQNYVYVYMAFARQTYLDRVGNQISIPVTVSNLGGYALSSFTSIPPATAGVSASIANNTCSNLAKGASCSFNLLLTPTQVLTNVGIKFGISANYNNGSNQTYAESQIIYLTSSNSYFITVGDAPTILSSINGAGWQNIINSGTVAPITWISYVNNAFYAYDMANNLFMTSSDGINFTGVGNVKSLVTSPGTSFVEQIAGDGNRTLVAGFSVPGMIMCSKDNGITWQLVYSSSNRIMGVAYGSNTFIAGGDNGMILKSIDCINWTIESSGISSGIRRGIYASGKFVFGTIDGKVIYSSGNGVWQNTIVDSAAAINALVFANNHFTIVGQKTNCWIANSSDSDPSTGWSSYNITESGGLRGLAYGNGKYIISSDYSTGSIYYSGSANSASSWTKVSRSQSNQLWSGGGSTQRAAAFGNNKFVSVDGSQGQIVYSLDGVTWSLANSGVKLQSVISSGTNTAFAVGRWGMGYKIDLSTTPVTITSVRIVYSNWLMGVTYDGSNFAAVDDVGNIYTTTNSTGSWIKVNLGITGTKSIAFGSSATNKYVIVGGSTATPACLIRYSNNLSSWSSVSCPVAGTNNSTTNALNNVTYANTTVGYLATGESGTVIYGITGNTWSSSIKTGLATGLSLTASAYCSSKYMVVGADSSGVGVIYTTDSLSTGSWTQQATGLSLKPLTSVSCSGTNFVAVSSKGNIYYSSDSGVTWSVSSSSIMNGGLYSVMFKS